MGIDFRKHAEVADRNGRIKSAIFLEMAIIAALAVIYFGGGNYCSSGAVEVTADGYIKWVDCYNLTKFLYKNRSEVHKMEGTKEWKRTFEMKEDSDLGWIFVCNSEGI